MSNSNFTKLRDSEHGYLEIYNAAHLAEKLFVDGHYHLIPTALRMYAEGVLTTILGGRSCGRDNYDNTLAEKISSFRKLKAVKQHRLSTNIVQAFDFMKTQGNKASHFEPKQWENEQIVALFNKAMIIHNFLLSMKGESVSDDFSFDKLPPSTNINKDGEKERIELEEQIRFLSEQLDGFKRERIEFENQLLVIEKDKECLQKKIENANLLKEQYKKNGEQLTEKHSLERTDYIEKLTELESDKKNLHHKIETLEIELEATQKDLRRKREQELFYNRKTATDGLTEQRNIEKENKKKSHLPQMVGKQKDLLKLSDGKHFVNSPPGTGKTTLLTKRLEVALESYHSDEDIICLTFTNRAAQEMRERASFILGDRKPFIGNFHSFCLEVIRASNLSSNVKHASILTDDYRNEIFPTKFPEPPRNMQRKGAPPLLREGVKAAWEVFVSLWRYNYKNESENYFFRNKNPKKKRPSLRSNFFEMYSALMMIHLGDGKNHTKYIKQILIKKLPELLTNIEIQKRHDKAVLSDQPDIIGDPDQYADIIWEIFENFLNQKKRFECLDFDDILCYGLSQLKKNGSTKKFIQVDEVQDLNQLQWEIIDALSDTKSHTFTVGDVDQSIYSFLGADIDLLKERIQDYNQHNLSKNYRSYPEIIKVLNQYRFKHWQLQGIESCREVDDQKQPAAILFEFQDSDSEMNYHVGKIKKTIEEDPSRQFGVLFPKNDLCNDFGKALRAQEVSFFQVSDSDLMEKPIIQDWLSLLRIAIGNDRRVDWWRMTHRLSKQEKEGASSRFMAMHFVNSLLNNGISVPDAIVCSGSKVNLAEQLVDSFRNDGVVVFDVETTGLEFTKDFIVQLAAVHVKNGVIIKEFNKIIDPKKDGFRYDSDMKRFIEHFEKSQKIHNLTLDDSKTVPVKEGIEAFFEFTGSKPMIAHNLTFDRTMIMQALDRFAPNSEKQHFYGKLQFDTLALSRLLFPELKKYKLEFLLDTFKLEGINSHNALDDVKATASLLNYLVSELEKRVHLLEDILNDIRYRKIVDSFAMRWPVIRDAVDEYRLWGNSFSLEAFLKRWIEIAKEQHLYPNNQEEIKEVIDEIEKKLIPWLNKNNYEGLINDLVDDSPRKVWDNEDQEIERRRKAERLFTLKEIDLIDPEKDKVIISTIHRSKGLEFETVVLPQVVDGMYPFWMPEDTPKIEKEKNIKEGKRLLYVGLSRPLNKLIVSYHKKWRKYDRQFSPLLTGFEDAFARWSI